MTRPWLPRCFSFATLLMAGALLTACPAKKDAAEDPEGLAGASGSAESSGVQAVYPAAPDVLPKGVKTLCEALHTLPNRRKTDCCKSGSGVLLTSECERNLAGAVTAGGLDLDHAQVRTCTAALDAAHVGCDWIGPHMPPLPEACRAVVQGKLEEGAVCRSSLECRDDLRCAGGGPTDRGKCRPSPPLGTACRTAVDPLATYLRLDVDQTRPPCKAGFCDRNICRPDIAPGEACRASVQCSDGHRCADGKCVEGALGAAGQACTGGDCEVGLRCVDRVCAKPRAIGEVCRRHVDCQAGCIDGHCKRICSAAELLRALPGSGPSGASGAPVWNAPTTLPGLKPKKP